MNKKLNKKNTFSIIAAILLLAAIVIFLYPRKRFHERINDLRKETVPMFDSLSKQMNTENAFANNVYMLIKHNDLALANQLIDSALNNNPAKGIYHTYKGMVHAAGNNYLQAIQEYDQSMLLNRSNFPLALSKKAEALIKLNDYKNAIENYKKAAVLNEDFNYQVATTFEVINKKDSALKYYLKYQKHYPEKKIISQKIDFLSK